MGDSFLDVLAKSYGTGVYEEDFVTQSEQARQTINGWVSTETNDKINDLLPEGSVDASTRLVLVNAVHLKLPWATAFDASATAPQAFTTGAGATVQAPFMNRTDTFAYADDGVAQTIVLPLAGNQQALVVSLPHGDLAAYEAGLTATSGPIAPPRSSSQVALSLPKVMFTSASFSLANSLKAMGMTDAFDPGSADFSGMCTEPTLDVADVLQKAMIAHPGERGRSRGGDGGFLDASVAPPPGAPIPMVVNRPYVISIVDLASGAVLFLGHVEDPTDAGLP